jgi:hypothetical protein
MPARKPSALITRNDTKGEREIRMKGESAMSPKTKLTTKPPARLKGHKIASELWKRLLSLYAVVDGEIVNAFDEDILVSYCLLIEEEKEFDGIFIRVTKHIDFLQRMMVRLKKNRSLSAKDIKKFQRLIDRARDSLIQLDARRDSKRKLSILLAQALYLTPRSRWGVAPPEKVNEPETEMDKLLRG